MDYLYGPNLITWKMWQRETEEWVGKMSLGGFDLLLQSLKVEEGALSPGMWAVSRSWKRQGNGISPRDSKEEHSLADALVFSSMRLNVGLLTYITVR